MSNAIIEIIILAAVAGFLFFRLRDVLGRRTGHENPSDYFRAEGSSPTDGPEESASEKVVPFPGAEHPDPTTQHTDIEQVTDLDGPIGKTLIQAKEVEPGFNAGRFVEGARSAYEMILMAFEAGDKSTLKPLLSDDVYGSFSEVIDQRAENNLSVDARFIGLRESKITDARLADTGNDLQIDVRFDAEMIVSVRNAEGEVVDGDPSAVRRMNDVWTFQRHLGDRDPGWLLVETGG